MTVFGKDSLPEEEHEAERLVVIAQQFDMIDDILYFVDSDSQYGNWSRAIVTQS